MIKTIQKIILWLLIALSSLYIYSSLEFNIQVSKKRKGLIAQTTEIADNAYTTYSSLTNLFK